jgi:WD40 repeat protein
MTELALDHRLTLELRELMPAGPAERDPARGDAAMPDPEHEALVALLQEAVAGKRYEILGVLGYGGMGVVYEVRDLVLQRKLAMKVVGAEGRRASSESPRSGRRLARFLEEVRITGQLDHPAIIPIHELGLDSQGRAYFTMRNVRGRNLHEVLEEFERGVAVWSLQRLVGVIQRACEAVGYAHSKLIVHRDLKPSNIMVGRFSAVYVIDWGVAKVLPGEAGGSAKGSASSRRRRAMHGAVHLKSGPGEASGPPQMTLEGEVIGTPAYMAPEQARGTFEEVDSRADVYSMGAILYRLLSGRTPYDEGSKGGTPHTAWQRLLDGPPAKLSEIAPEAPPELVAVCDRAMTRDKEERYSDMAGLSADLRAWLEGRVVRAHKTGVVVEARKWVGRNRALASAGLLIVLALALLPALIVQHSVDEARSRDRLARSELTLQALGLVEEEPAESLRAAIQAAEAGEDYVSRTALLAALVPLALSASLDHAGSVHGSAWSLEGSRRAWSPAGDAFVVEGRPLEGGPSTIRVWNVKARGFEGPSFAGRAGEVFAFHPAGRMVASGAEDGSVSIHDLKSGDSVRLQGEGGHAHTDVVSRLAFAPDGTLLASASWDGSVRLWDVATGRLERALTDHTGAVTTIEFDATGERLLSASGPVLTGYTSDATARVWDVASGTCTRVFEGHEQAVSSARFDATGQLVLSTSYDRSAKLWDPRTGEIRATLEFEGVAWDGAFSPDGSTLAVAFDSGLLVREVASDSEVRVGKYAAHEGRAVTDVEFSPSGNRLLTTGHDGFGRVWALDAGPDLRLTSRLRGRAETTFGSWSPDESAIVTVNYYTTCLWYPDGNPTTDWEQVTKEPATHARFHPAGDRVLLTFEDSPAYEYLFTPGVGLSTPPSKLGDANARDAIASANGAWTVVAEVGGPVQLWRREGAGASRMGPALGLDALALEASSAHDLVGVILAGGGAAIVDCSSEPEVTEYLATGETVSAIRCSEDGLRVALGTARGHLMVADLAAKGALLLDEQLAPGSPGQAEVLDLCFYDAGRFLVSAGPGAGVQVWDVDAGREVEHIGIEEWRPMAGVFVLDGRDVLGRSRWSGHIFQSGLAGGETRILRPAPGRSSHRRRTTGWSLDRAERRLLSISLDGAATVWDLERFEPWVTFTGHDAPVLACDLSRDGTWAVTADASGRVCVWPTDPLEWAKRALPVYTGR